MSTTEETIPAAQPAKKPHWKTRQKQQEAQVAPDAKPVAEKPLEAKETTEDIGLVPQYSVYPVSKTEQKTFKGHTHTLEVFIDRQLKRFALDHEPDNAEVIRLLSVK